MLARVNAFLLCMLVSLTIYGYGRLPERIPIHFGLGGEPNGWGPRWTAILLPIVGIVTIVFLYFIARISVRNPKLINLPNKKKFLELPEKDQRWVVEPLVESMDYVIFMMAWLFIILQLSIFRAAAGLSVAGLLQATLVITTISITIVPIFMLVKIQRRLAEAIRRNAMSGDMR